MKKTRERLWKYHDALVQVIQWLDSNSDKEGRHSDKPIREVVDNILNHERKLHEDSNIEIETIEIEKRNNG
ncbi:hypothetical protein [uncultured Mediterranean phage uvMED]|jgi:hypothetical protein|nr:hypothetical protein [uncultured Mediterranean phage uvMED]|tara:strand:+ start:67 stop:279 length:213 start_codon:yes stop_codon:yes gene_type:complete